MQIHNKHGLRLIMYIATVTARQDRWFMRLSLYQANLRLSLTITDYSPTTMLNFVSINAQFCLDLPHKLKRNTCKVAHFR